MRTGILSAMILILPIRDKRPCIMAEYLNWNVCFSLRDCRKVFAVAELLTKL
ncbi:MAG: hypothetical protein RR416_01140 [Clostridia bacterium]